jgi:hypothetical protein
MTHRRYAHVLEDMEDEGGRAMDELFKGASFFTSKPYLPSASSEQVPGYEL